MSTNLINKSAIVKTLLAALLLVIGQVAFAAETAQNAMVQNAMVIALPKMILTAIEAPAQVLSATTMVEGATPTWVCIVPDSGRASDDFVDACSRLAAEFPVIQFRLLDAQGHPELVQSLLGRSYTPSQPVVYLNAPPSPLNGHDGRGFVFAEQDTHARMTISLGEKIIAQYTGIDKELLVPRELDAASWERARKGDRIVVVLYPDLTQGGADAADSFSMFALWGTEAVKYTQHDGDVPRVYRLSYASTLYGGVIGAGAKKLGQPTLAVLHVQVNGHGTKIGTLSLYDPANCSGLQAKDLSEAEAQSWMNARGFVLPPNANNKVVAWAGVPQLELATAKPAGVQHGFVQRP